MNGVLHILLIIFKEDVQFFLNIILDGIYDVPFKSLLEIKHEQRTMKKKFALCKQEKWSQKKKNIYLCMDSYVFSACRHKCVCAHMDKHILSLIQTYTQKAYQVFISYCYLQRFQSQLPQETPCTSYSNTTKKIWFINCDKQCRDTE